MATWRATGAGGGTSGTGDRATAYTAAVGDLLVVFVNASDNANTTPTMSDNQGGTYARIGHAAWNSSLHSMSVFVREQIVTAAVAHTITAATGSNSAAQIIIQSISGMFRTGANAVRQFAKQENQAASTTPAPSFSSSALTNNLTLVAVASADTTTSPPASWTERFDTSQSTPTTALEVATRNSGFTGTTITFGATQSTEFASMAVELDGSAEDTPDAAVASATITNPTVTIGGVTSTPSAATASATITDPDYEYEQNSQESEPDAAVATATVTNPSVTIGGVSSTPSAALGSATAANPTYAVGGVSVSPAAASAAAMASNPSLTIGGVTATPAAAEAAATAANVIRDIRIVIALSGSVTASVSVAGEVTTTSTVAGQVITTVTD